MKRAWPKPEHARIQARHKQILLPKKMWGEGGRCTQGPDLLLIGQHMKLTRPSSSYVISSPVKLNLNDRVRHQGL